MMPPRPNQPMDVMPQPSPVPHSQPNMAGPQRQGAMQHSNPNAIGTQNPMAGQGAGGGQGLMGQISDPLLKKIQSSIEQNVTPEIQDEYKSIVMAGLDLLSNDATTPEILQGISVAESAPPERKAEMYGHFAAKGISVIFNQTMEGQPPEKQELFIMAAPLAGLTLMTHMMEYSEAASGQPVDKKLVSEAARHASDKILDLFGIDQKKRDEAMLRGQSEYGKYANQMEQGSQGMMGSAGAPPSDQPPTMEY